MNRGRGKNGWILLLMMLAGVVIGGFLGQYLGGYPSFQWLAYGKAFGLTTPLILDLGVIVLNFGLTIKFTVAGIIGIVIAAVIYRKM